MSYQVDLYKPGTLLVPLGEGANRYLLFQERPRLRASTPTQLIFALFWFQQAINAGSTDA